MKVGGISAERNPGRSDSSGRKPLLTWVHSKERWHWEYFPINNPDTNYFANVCD